jgi:hypothetical protein
MEYNGIKLNSESRYGKRGGKTTIIIFYDAYGWKHTFKTMKSAKQFIDNPPCKIK